MAALAPVLAPVIPITVKRGRPSKEDVATLELAMRRSEELEAAEAVCPLLRRMELVAHEVGPVAWQVYAALAMWHVRHQRRWSPEDEPGAVA